MSGFDPYVWSFTGSNLLVWVGSFLLLTTMFLVGFLYLSGRTELILLVSMKVVDKLVEVSKLSIMGGSHLAVMALFLLILLVNLTGLLPYAFSVSSQVVFSVTLAFSFWFSLVSSSLIFGQGLASVANLVFLGVGVLGGVVLCWVEKLSILLRLFTLSVRLAVNVAVGQAAISLLGDVGAHFFSGGCVSPLLVVPVGAMLLGVESIISFVQAYLFCLLLSSYGNEHST